MVSRENNRPFAMIIEDDRDGAALFRHVLDMAGFITEINLRGDKAMERLEITTPDMVLLDLNLAGIAGSVILKNIRSDERLKNTSIIVVTGYPELADGLGNQADLILHKPVSIDQLSTFIKRFQKIETAALLDSPYDESTRLYHRKYFINRLMYSIDHTRRFGGDEFGVLFVDCDNFLLVQQQGADFANQLLDETAKVLLKAVRPYDTISHLGSGQFFIQVEDLPSRDILFKISQRVHKNLTARILDKFGFEMTANVGMVLCDSNYCHPEEIFRDADIAMFYAKSNPFTDLVIFDPAKHGAFRDPEKYAAIMRAGLQGHFST